MSMGVEKLYGMVLRELESDAIIDIDLDTYKEISEFVGNLQRQEYDGVENEIHDMMADIVGKLAGMLLKTRLEKGTVSGAEQSNLLDEEKYILDAEEEMQERMDLVYDAAYHGKPLLLGRMAERHKKRMVTIRFLHNVDRLMGSDYNDYGPFQEEYVASIPYDNARSLVARGDAVQLHLPD